VRGGIEKSESTRRTTQDASARRQDANPTDSESGIQQATCPREARSHSLSHPHPNSKVQREWVVECGFIGGWGNWTPPPQVRCSIYIAALQAFAATSHPKQT